MLQSSCLEDPNITTNLHKLYPPVEGPMLPKNMPGFKGLCVHQTPAASTDAAVDVMDPHCTNIMCSIFLYGSHGHKKMSSQCSDPFSNICQRHLYSPENPNHLEQCLATNSLRLPVLPPASLGPSTDLTMVVSSPHWLPITCYLRWFS